MSRQFYGYSARMVTFVLCLAIPLICTTNAQAQYTSLSTAQVQLGASTPGDITVETGCYGSAWFDDQTYYHYLSIYVWSEGTSIASGSVQGVGSTYLEVRGPTTARRTQRLIECSLDAGGYGGYHSYYLPARDPVDLTTVLDNFSYVSFGNYERLRHYAVSDNYSRRYGYSDAPVFEAYSISNNGCNLTLATASAYLNGSGEFDDRYTTFGQAIPACAVVPNCVTQSTQTIDIDFAASFSHSVDWSCTNVAVNR